jgi:hypothetical protein
MPAKLSKKTILRKNKKVSSSKLNKGRAMLRDMRELGVTRRTYNLASPYSRKAYLGTTRNVIEL